MTVAVCLQCGEFKHGAFNPCLKCGFTPDTDESLTKHLLVTDHFHDRETLEAISTRIKSGEEVTFSPESLQQAWVSKEAMEAEQQRFNRGCLLVFAVIALFVVLYVVFFFL